MARSYFRYILSRTAFLLMGLPVDWFRKEVESLWMLSEDARMQKLDSLLAQNSPSNAEGIEVKGIEILKVSPCMSKEQFRAMTESVEHKNSDAKFDRHTAGTTGEPTHVHLSRIELARMLAVRDYCFRHYGFKLGQKEARLWGRPESGIKLWVKNFVLNRRVFYPVGPQGKKDLLQLLRWSPDYLYGYSSLLLEAAKLLESLDVDFVPPKCVVCTAENILPSQKKYLSRIFRAPVAEEYGSTEFDIIAFDCMSGHRHLVNPWLVVDAYDDNCLISDVSRSSQDIIRYSLGDSISVKKSQCDMFGDKYVVDQICGRTTDSLFYVDKNNKIHEVVFSNLFDKYFRNYSDAFSFKMEQNKLAILEVEVSSIPVIGFEGLQCFFESGIKNMTGFNIEVTVSINRCREKGQKRNYFIQNVSLSS
jgi:phenylacetate-CoA ligase